MFTDTEIAILAGHNSAMAKANRGLARKDALLGKLNDEVDRLRHALSLEIMHSAGSVAQIDALYDALKAVDPDNALFKETGKRLSNGRSETVLTTHYYKGHDAKGKELKIDNPERLRDGGR